MIYTPEQNDVIDTITNLLEDMISTVNSVSRVIEKIENYVKMPNTEKKLNLKNIIENSVRYKWIYDETINKVKNDFKLVENYVNTNYEKCREIYEFDKNNNQEEIISDDTKMDDIKEKIRQLKTWTELI